MNKAWGWAGNNGAIAAGVAFILAGVFVAGCRAPQSSPPKPSAQDDQRLIDDMKAYRASESGQGTTEATYDPKTAIGEEMKKLSKEADKLMDAFYAIEQSLPLERMFDASRMGSRNGRKKSLAELKRYRKAYDERASAQKALLRKMLDKVEAERGPDPDPSFDPSERARNRFERVDEAWYAAFDATEAYIGFAERANARFDAQKGRVMLRNSAQYNRLGKQVLKTWTRVEEVEEAVKVESARSVDESISLLESNH